MLFGTKKLRNLGSDLGGALKGFKTAIKDDDAKDDEESDNSETDESDDDAAAATAEKSEKK